MISTRGAATAAVPAGGCSCYRNVRSSPGGHTNRLPGTQPYMHMGKSFRIERDGLKVVGSVAGLCSDGNYLLELFVIGKDRIAREYVKRRMREDGAPDMPEGTAPCSIDE